MRIEVETVSCTGRGAASRQLIAYRKVWFGLPPPSPRCGAQAALAELCIRGWSGWVGRKASEGRGFPQSLQGWSLLQEVLAQSRAHRIITNTLGKAMGMAGMAT